MERVSFCVNGVVRGGRYSTMVTRDKRSAQRTQRDWDYHLDGIGVGTIGFRLVCEWCNKGRADNGYMGRGYSVSC